MKKHLKWIIPVGLIAILVFMMIGFNNKAVTLEQNAKTAWSNVETSYQRRTDLIPNLVNTVKGAANFEKSTLTAVVEARAKATSINVDVDNLNPEAIKKFQAAQSQVSSALSRLLVSVERYPNLTATQNFQNLQSQLEGTENRIATSRRRYNEAVNKYNIKIKKFPNSMFAGWFGFDEMTRYQADEGAEKAPEVKF